MGWHIFQPILAGARPLDRTIACFGATICLALTTLICAWMRLPVADVPLVVASIGSAAVLVFAVPASPLAQPWSVIGGNTVSALVGIAAFKAVPDLAIATGVAVGGAIALMSLCRCLHPPGGASAMTAVIGSQAVHDAGYAFAVVPVALNAVVLVLLGVVFHRISGKSYPHKPAPAAAPPGFHLEDIDAALADMADSFDISREDLDVLLSRAEAHAVARQKR
ncbi:HPP family protein [Sphingomonas turrisvirgatae]|uniref:HPP transmembrane region domain-containing protein n=1 Tax=Sphingomonas turrisvirgatae TaxID=1888892 RepID=A0A1E3LUE9_9SPHN|nr:HPP family protein [Sphingomonas turrisvirgatae]ODP37363.1 hypothetical protein BFL28_18335 [Sphingomonas turrisvirgatae]